jgi:peptide/nickel transport system ATP-binding protein
MTHLLSIENLQIAASRSGADRVLVDGLSLAVERGGTTALVGESGSGKTLTSLAAVGLLPAGLRMSSTSRISFDGTSLTPDSAGHAAALLGTRIGMVFQDPVGSLNPVLRIADHLAEALRRSGLSDGAAIRARSLALLDEAGLTDHHRVMHAWPHQLSGGMAQRVMIAIALAGDPDLLIADEPTASLDTTSQRGIINLLRRLRSERGLATLLIAHDLGVVAEMADIVTVIHAGQPAESAATDAVLYRSEHPYARGLVAAAIRLDRTVRPRPIPGPSGAMPEGGCRFRSRCWRADARCAAQFPDRSPTLAGGEVWCWNPVRPQGAEP